MISINSSGLREIEQMLNKLEREQLPFAAMLALTHTAQDVKQALVAEMSAVFDRPTRATLGGLYIESATKAKLEARVFIKDGRRKNDKGNIVGQEGVWGKGRAANRWLTAQVYGGARSQTGVEKRLSRNGVLAAGQYVVPGRALRLDAYGNVGQGRLGKILSGAGQLSGPGYDANATDSKRSRDKGNKRYFVIRKGSRPIGIAERLGDGKGSRNNIRMALAFVRAPSYQKRFDFFGVAERTARDQLPIRFELALARAIATRKR